MYRHVLAGIGENSILGIIRGELEIVRQVALQPLEFVFQFLECRRWLPRWVFAFLPIMR